MVEEGQKAPTFTLPISGGGEVALSGLKGKKVVLYFYPKDDTSGCTVEACEFRDQLPDFEGNGATVFGLSPDPVKSHDKFVAKLDLNFPLLADEDHAVCEAYGVWKEKSMYGRKYWGVERSTFLIDGDGTIQKVWRKVKPKGHAEEVARAVAQLA